MHDVKEVVYTSFPTTSQWHYLGLQIDAFLCNVFEVMDTDEMNGFLLRQFVF